MNLNQDKYRSVDVNELMKLHNKRMNRRIDMNGHENDEENEQTGGDNVSDTTRSQECVGNHRK